MRDRFYERRYNRGKRNGKDCYIWFRIDKFGEEIFNSAVHKVSLNVFRILKTKMTLSDYCIYI